MPQRGTRNWTDWGWSNSIPYEFTPGKYLISINMDPHTFNMNITTNNALIDRMRLTKEK